MDQTYKTINQSTYKDNNDDSYESATDVDISSQNSKSSITSKNTVNTIYSDTSGSYNPDQPNSDFPLVNLTYHYLRERRQSLDNTKSHSRDRRNSSPIILITDKSHMRQERCKAVMIDLSNPVVNDGNRRIIYLNLRNYRSHLLSHQRSIDKWYIYPNVVIQDNWVRNYLTVQDKDQLKLLFPQNQLDSSKSYTLEINQY